MAKGKKTGGRKPGSTNKAETHLIKTYSQAWLIKLGQEGFNRWADSHKNDAMKIVAGFVPRELSGPGGKDLIPPTYDLSKLTTAELLNLKAMQNKMALENDE